MLAFTGLAALQTAVVLVLANAVTGAWSPSSLR